MSTVPGTLPTSTANTLSPAPSKAKTIVVHTLTGIVIVVSIALSVWTAATFRTESEAGSLGSAMGQFVIPFLVAGGLTRNGSRYSKARGWLIASLAVLVVGISASYTAAQRHETTTTAMHEIADAFRVSSGKQEPTAHDREIAAQTAAAPQPVSSIGLVPGMTALAKLLSVELHDLQSSSAAIDLSGALASDTLVDLAKIATTRKNVGALRMVIKAQGTAMERYWSEARRYLQTARDDEGIRASFAQGFEDTNGPTQRIFREYHGVELELMDRYDELLNFAEARHAHLRLQDDLIVFDNDSDLAGFSAIRERVQAVMAREKEVVARYNALQASAQAKAIKLENEAR